MALDGFQQGLAQAQAKDFRGAIAAFNQVLQIDPEHAAAYHQRGLAHFQLGEVQQAIADYTHALRISSDHSSWFYARGLAYLTVGYLEAAVMDAKQAILRQSEDAAAYELLGNVRQRQGLTLKAIASYRKAAELYLDQREVAHCRRCLAQVRQLQPAPSSEPAAANYTAVDVSQFLQQAVQKAHQGRHRAAMEDLDWAVQIDPQDPQAYVYRGQVQAQLGSVREAIADYQTAARLFLERGDRDNTKQLIETIQALKQTQKFSAQSARVSARTPRPTVTAGTPSRQTQRKLLRLIGDDRRIVAGLVVRLKLKHPGMPEDWYWEKAIYDLERDRR